MSHAAVEAFNDVLTKVAVEYFGLGDFWSSAILSGDSKVTRKERLDKFAAHQGIAVLCNVLIISEGIDMPQAGCVFMGNPCHSKVRNVQRVCRANRLNPEHPNKIAKVFVWADQEDELLKFIALLKEIDTHFCQKVSVLSRRYERMTSGKKEQLQLATTDSVKLCVKMQEYRPVMTHERRALRRAQQLYQWVEERDGQLPRTYKKGKDKTEAKLTLFSSTHCMADRGTSATALSYPAVNQFLDF